MLNTNELENMRREIRKQEQILKNTRNYNDRIRKTRKWKNLALKARIAIPALLITGGVSVGSHMLGFGYPFKIDNLPGYKRYTVESTYDEGLTEIEDISVISDMEKPKLEVYYPYEKTEKGYTRKIVNYYLDKVDEVELYYAIKNKDYNFFINNLKSKSEKEDTIFYLPEDNTHKIVCKFSILSNEYVCELPETNDINGTVTTFDMLIVVFMNLIISGKYIVDYKKIKRDIEEEYSLVNEDNVLEHINDLRTSISIMEMGDHHVR